MPPKVEILHLSADNRAQTSRGYMRSDFPGLIFTKLGSIHHAFTLRRRPIFMKSAPVRFESYADFLHSEPPIPPQEDRKQMLVVETGNPFPLSSGEDWQLGEKQAAGVSLEEEMLGWAQDKAARQDLGGEAQRGMYMMVMSAFVFIAAILGFALIKVVWIDDKPTDQVAHVFEVPDGRHPSTPPGLGAPMGDRPTSLV